MKYTFLIAATLLLSIASVSAAQKTEWTCFSADKSVSLVISHEEPSYTAQGLVTVATIQVPMPCQVTGAAFLCLENTDQTERLGAAIGESEEGQFSGYVYIHNKVTGFQKFADVTCTKTN